MWYKKIYHWSSLEWNLSDVIRKDVAQADIANLMAALIGVPFPMNSVGRVPIEYIDADASTRVQMMRANAMQVLEQYRVKERQMRDTTLALFFTPFRCV